MERHRTGRTETWSHQRQDNKWFLIRYTSIRGVDILWLKQYAKTLHDIQPRKAERKKAYCEGSNQSIEPTTLFDIIAKCSQAKSRDITRRLERENISTTLMSDIVVVAIMEADARRGL